MSQQNDALAAATRLAGAVEGMAGELRRVNDRLDASERRERALAQYGRLNRILIVVAIVGFVLDVTATTIAFVAYAKVSSVLAQVERNSATDAQLHQTNVTACQSGNVIRAQQERALDAILTLGPPQPGETKAQRQEAEALLARDGRRSTRAGPPGTALASTTSGGSPCSPSLRSSRSAWR